MSDGINIKDLTTEQKQYYELVMRKTAEAKELIALDDSLEFDCIFHYLMNLELTPEERLARGLRIKR